MNESFMFEGMNPSFSFNKKKCPQHQHAEQNRCTREYSRFRRLINRDAEQTRGMIYTTIIYEYVIITLLFFIVECASNRSSSPVP